MEGKKIKMNESTTEGLALPNSVKYLDVITNNNMVNGDHFEVVGKICLPLQLNLESILRIHSIMLKDRCTLSEDVDLLELARQTKNLTITEIERLVRAALFRARSQLPKADPKAGENVRIMMRDFEDALENDFKPAFVNSVDYIDCYISPGIISWGEPIQRIFDFGRILTQRAWNEFGIVSVLLEGRPGAGKTAIAAQIAKDSGFPSITVSSPHDIVRLSGSEKCAHIHKIFDESSRLVNSCILIDSIERHIEFSPLGPVFSNSVLKALMTVLKEKTSLKNNRKLLVICTTSHRKALEELGLIDCFTSVLNVPYLSTVEQLVAVLRKTDVFPENQIAQLVIKIGSRRLSIGIKKLMDTIDLIKEKDKDDRVFYFVSNLEFGGFLEIISPS